jgi:hypothetical protein
MPSIPLNMTVSFLEEKRGSTSTMRSRILPWESRFDMYNNSNLRNPTDSYSGMGIGRWYVQKRLDKVEISAGYLYDQIGSGCVVQGI